MNPHYQIFIPTKGRSDSRLTIKMFDAINVPYKIFVEEQEFNLYAEYVAIDRIVILPHQNKGLTVTRNYIWNFAAERELEWFWTFDDNIFGLRRFNNNWKTPCADGTILAVIEDFVQRYENIAIAGCNYEYFVKRKFIVPPYVLNTRIYSNMLIRTFAQKPNGEQYRNRLYFNDDTDLCLQVLKDGWCTVLFNAFLIDKGRTMTMNGGMTENYLATNQRKEFAEELQQAHPDIVQVVEKFNRYHHQVDYSVFKQQLKRRMDVEIPSGVNNFGMVLQERVNGEWIDADQ